MTWRFVGVSVAGTSHRAESRPCEDCCVYSLAEHAGGAEVVIAIASDGAGSAAHGAVGARLVCEELCASIANKIYGLTDLRDLNLDDLREMMVTVRKSIYRTASELSAEPRDFASTLVAAIVGPHVAHFLQVGDGGIVVGADQEYSVVFWPDNGEYANMTRFVSDPDVFEHIQHCTTNTPDDFALFSDGIQRLALVFAARSAHAPFFAPMFDHLRKAPEEELGGLNQKLAAFLDSEMVNERTDDDKTLILATRRICNGS